MKSYQDAIQLKKLGHPDFFDCLVFSSARNSESHLLSVNEKFNIFLETNRIRKDFFLEGKEFIKMDKS